MKLSFIMLFISFGLANAGEMYGQSVTLNINLENKTVQNALDKIEEQSEFKFFYNNNQIDTDRTISIQSENSDVFTLLSKIFENTDVTYKVLDRSIILSTHNLENLAENTQPTQDDKRRVTGTVKDEAGLPIIGANIIVEGVSGLGTMTDMDGNFFLEITDEAVLEVSFISYVTQTIAVSASDQNLFIVLKDDTESLDELIVIGYGMQKKSNITSAIKSIDGADLITVASPNVEDMLQGQVAGVQVYQESGRPGERASIRIRGKSSLGSSVDPLWVVDGVIQPSDPNLNPMDIESISILKDAAATSLYGSRATSGVIVVKTKRAKAGTTIISVSARLGAGSINDGNFKLMNSAEMAEQWTMMGMTVPDAAKTTDFDWWKDATQVSLTQDYNISFSGGNETIQAYVSGGFYNENGTIKGSEISRYRVLANIDYNITKWLKIKPRINASYHDDYDSGTPDLHALYAQMPWDSPTYSDGELVSPKDLRAGAVWYGRDRNNYKYDAQWNYSKTRVLNTEGGFDGEIKILDCLSFISTNSIQFSNSKSTIYADPQSISGKGVNGSLEEIKGMWMSKFSNQMLRFNHSFNRKWNLIALLAYEYNDYMQEESASKKEGFFPGSEVFDNAANIRHVTGEKYEWALSSVLTNVNLSYDSRYFFQASYRNDASSKFGKDKRNGSFFSVSGGWSLADESFMDNYSKWLNVAKLRVSYGSVGNLPRDYYPHYSLYDIKGTYVGQNGSFPNQLGNSNLSWEKSYETNIGLDLELFDRLSFSADYYIKNTSDLVYLVSLPSLSGFENYWDNIGAVRNNGLELYLGYDVFKNRDFEWNLNLNWSMNRNEITELYEGKDVIDHWQVRRVGEDINTWYLRKWAGVDPENGDPLWEKVAEDGSITKTNNYNEATLQTVGKATPDFTGSINSFMSYKGFTFSMNWNYVVGNELYHYRENFDSNGAYTTYNQMKFVDGWSRWEKPGDVATHPRLVEGGNLNSQRNSSRYLEDGSYLRLRNLTIGYNLPSKALSKIGIKGLRISLSGDNLLTFTKYSGRDPEVGENAEGSYKYPNIKKFVLGLNINF